MSEGRDSVVSMVDSETDPVVLGRSVVVNGALGELRSTLKWSCNAMAEALAVSPITYGKWERRPDTRLWTETARRVGDFYRRAAQELVDVELIDEFTPFYKVAMYLGVPQEMLVKGYRQGRYEGEDWGVLGLWMHRDDLAELTGRR